jgi:hypothetical protein
METILNSLQEKLDSFNFIRALFEKHPNLDIIRFDFEVEPENDYYVGLYSLQIGSQTWEYDEDDEDNFNGFYGDDFSGITNSEILSKEELKLLQNSIHELILLTGDTEGEYHFNRDEILKIGTLNVK